MVSSTVTGVIIGSIVHETACVLDRNVVVLNNIHINIMYCISSASCADVVFRNMRANPSGKIREGPLDTGHQDVRLSKLR